MRSVESGPFQGLKYPTLVSVGSELSPKLLGTYESEIVEWIKEVTRKSFEGILNIGCGEGYYAVGLARCFPGLIISAFDTDPRARELCREMALANEVDNVQIFQSCSRDLLSSLEEDKAYFILSDCEGAERELFDAQIARHLRRSTFIIELHDFKDRSISGTVLGAFRDTHRIDVVSSLSDHLKAETYMVESLRGANYGERFHAFAERRPEVMSWLRASPTAA